MGDMGSGQGMSTSWRPTLFRRIRSWTPRLRTMSSQTSTIFEQVKQIIPPLTSALHKGQAGASCLDCSYDWR